MYVLWTRRPRYVREGGSLNPPPGYGPELVTVNDLLCKISQGWLGLLQYNLTRMWTEVIQHILYSRHKYARLKLKSEANKSVKVSGQSLHGCCCLWVFAASFLTKANLRVTGFTFSWILVLCRICSSVDYCMSGCRYSRCGWLPQRTCYVERWDVESCQTQRTWQFCRSFTILRATIFVLWCSARPAVVVVVSNVFHETSGHCCSVTVTL